MPWRALAAFLAIWVLATACGTAVPSEAAEFCTASLDASEILSLAPEDLDDEQLGALALDAVIARLDDDQDAAVAKEELLAYVDDEQWFADGCIAAYELSLTAYRQVHGSITVADRFCDDLGGYSDIPFMQPILRDVDGKFITELDAGLLNGIVTDTDRSLATIVGSPSCRSTFEAEDVPRLEKYLLDAGRRGEFILDADDFRSDIYSGGDNEPQIFDLSIGG